MCKSSVSIFRLSSSNRRNTSLKTLTPQIPSIQPLQKVFSSNTAQDIQAKHWTKKSRRMHKYKHGKNSYQGKLLTLANESELGPDFSAYSRSVPKKNFT